MDAEKLIEEAGRLCDAADPGPWELDDNVVMSGEEAVAECYLFGDARFIARARTLVPDLVTALRAERERAEFLRRCWEKAEQAYSGMFRVAVFAIIIGLMIVIGLAFARAQP